MKSMLKEVQKYAKSNKINLTEYEKENSIATYI